MAQTIIQPALFELKPECEDCQTELTDDDCVESLASVQNRLLCPDCVDTGPQP